MNVFFNVTEKDRIETIEKRVDATKLLNEVVPGNVNPEFASTLLKILSNQVYALTSYYVFKRDLAKAKAEGKCFTSSFDTGKVEVIDEKHGVTTNYVDRAQELSRHIFVGAGHERVFAGPVASSYLKLDQMYTQEGREDPMGIYCIGTYAGVESIPIYRAPADVIPDDIIILERTKDLLEVKLENLRGM